MACQVLHYSMLSHYYSISIIIIQCLCIHIQYLQLSFNAFSFVFDVSNYYLIQSRFLCTVVGEAVWHSVIKSSSDKDMNGRSTTGF